MPSGLSDGFAGNSKAGLFTGLTHDQPAVLSLTIIFGLLIILLTKMEDIRKRVGQQIRDARKAKGLTQTDLAELMGVKKVTISGYERGRQNLTIETLQKLAHTLGGAITIEP